MLVTIDDECPIHKNDRSIPAVGTCKCDIKALGIVLGFDACTTQCMYISDCLTDLGLSENYEFLSFGQLDSVPPLRKMNLDQ